LAQVASQDNLILQRSKWKDNGQCVVFVSGCFDLLHPGHVRLLEQARSHGDILIVGVQSDASVRNGYAAVLSGQDDSELSRAGKSPRPITPAAERAEILAALAAVDYVVEFDDFSPSKLIGRLSPDIIVEGGSRRVGPSESAEERPAEARGAKLVRILLEPGYSTTRLIERITQAGT
jgi:D-beta-D-heptose 7-phosphate kinase/D-beta-D-heptose 1-phosphate adenosyltransferase